MRALTFKVKNLLIDKISSIWSLRSISAAKRHFWVQLDWQWSKPPKYRKS